MIYALNTRDVSDHERRLIARQIRDGQDDILSQDDRVVLVRDTEVGKGVYYCIYCTKREHKWRREDRIRFDHGRGRAHIDGVRCIGSKKGLPGIVNPPGATMPGQP